MQGRDAFCPALLFIQNARTFPSAGRKKCPLFIRWWVAIIAPLSEGGAGARRFGEGVGWVVCATTLLHSRCSGDPFINQPQSPFIRAFSWSPLSATVKMEQLTGRNINRWWISVVAKP